MKSIVGLTDFSVTADNALRYAAALAQKCGAVLTVLHVYQIPVTMNDMPVMLISAEEMKNNVDEQLSKTVEELHQNYAGAQIISHSLIGDVSDEVSTWAKENNPDLIVIGTHQSTGVERMLLGSTAAVVVRHAHLPVITVPQHYTSYVFDSIVLATDLSHKGDFPAEPVIRLVQTLGARLQVIHIDAIGEHSDFSIPELQVLQPEYRVIKDEDVNQTLLRLQEEVDLLIILPHEHNIIERMFFRLHTEPLLRDAQKPVLTIRG